MADNVSGSVASYLSLGRAPLAQLSSLMKLASEEESGEQTSDGQFNSITSEDDFIILEEEEEEEEDHQQLLFDVTPVNTSVCTDSVEPATSSEFTPVRDVGKKNDTVQTTHDIPLTPMQQKFLRDRESARDTLCSKLERKGFRATFNFQQHQVDVESKGGNRHEEALDVIEGSVIEMKLNLSRDLLEQMSQLADFADGEHVILPELSGTEDVLAVIDKTDGSITLVGMADAMGCLEETINKSKELLDKKSKNQEVQRASASVHGDKEPRGTSAPEQTLLYSHPCNAPREEHQAVDSDPITDIVPVNDDSLDYLCQFKDDEIRWIGKKEGVSICDTPHGYEVRGAATAVGRAVVTLRNTIERVKSNKFTFETSVDMGKFAEATRNASNNHNCIIGYKQTIGSVRSRMGTKKQSSTTGKEKVKVTVVLDRIENQNANVIVNTTNKELKLSDGHGVSHSLLREAGDEIQQVLTDIYPHGMTYGDLAVSHSGRLTTCEKIYHGALPFHTGTRNRVALSKCYEWLVSLVFRCLIQACKDGFETIAMPAFGTGALQYPTKNVAQLMFHAIDLFTQDERAGPLKEIFIVISRESRLEVKQLFLAHRLSHKLKTRQLAHPRREWNPLLMLIPFYLGWFRQERDFGLPAYLNQEVRRRDSRCEVRVKVSDTLVQIINVGVAEACDVTGAVLLIWGTEDIMAPDGHSGLTSIDRNRHDWDCCREQVADLKRVRCVADTTTVPGTTLIHTYSNDSSQTNVSEALERGLRLAAKKECYHVTVPVPPEGSLAARPDQASAAIAFAVNRRSCGVYVVTVAIPDNDIYIGIVTGVARRGIMQEPPDVTKVSLVDSLWKVTFSRQHSRREMHTTAVDAVMVVTSDSEETNRNAARDVERELHVQLKDVLHVQTNLSRD